MRGDLVRSRCGVCGELGNHGDVPHSVAMDSHYDQKLHTLETHEIERPDCKDPDCEFHHPEVRES